MTLPQLTADLYHIMKSHSKVMVFCAICHLSASDLPFFAPAQSCYKHKLLKINNYSIQLVSDFGIFCISRKRSLKNHQPESTSEIIAVILQISIFCPRTRLNTTSSHSRRGPSPQGVGEGCLRAVSFHWYLRMSCDLPKITQAICVRWGSFDSRLTGF